MNLFSDAMQIWISDAGRLSLVSKIRLCKVFFNVSSGPTKLIGRLGVSNLVEPLLSLCGYTNFSTIICNNVRHLSSSNIFIYSQFLCHHKKYIRNIKPIFRKSKYGPVKKIMNMGWWTVNIQMSQYKSQNI